MDRMREKSADTDVLNLFIYDSADKHSDKGGVLSLLEDFNVLIGKTKSHGIRLGL